MAAVVPWGQSRGVIELHDHSVRLQKFGVLIANNMPFVKAPDDNKTL
jgi:hypothetical protein